MFIRFLLAVFRDLAPISWMETMLSFTILCWIFAVSFIWSLLAAPGLMTCSRSADPLFDCLLTSVSSGEMIGFLTANPTPKKPKRSVKQHTKKYANKRAKNDDEGVTDDEGSCFA